MYAIGALSVRLNGRDERGHERVGRQHARCALLCARLSAYKGYVLGWGAGSAICVILWYRIEIRVVTNTRWLATCKLRVSAYMACVLWILDVKLCHFTPGCCSYKSC